jgi:hypothetical protein
VVAPPSGCPLRDVLSKHAQSELALLKIDFSNAFNRVDRQVFMQATVKEFPGLANWTNWCYSQKSILLYDHRELIDSSSGVQQGDPLGPLYFCFALASLVEEIRLLGPVYQKWYMDDGGIVASGSGRSFSTRGQPWVCTSTQPSVSGRG